MNKIKLKSHKILITGTYNLVTQLLIKQLRLAGCTHVYCPSDTEYNLANQAEAKALFRDIRPHIVIHFDIDNFGDRDNSLNACQISSTNTNIVSNCINNGVIRMCYITNSKIYSTSNSAPLNESNILQGRPDTNIDNIRRAMLSIMESACDEFGLGCSYLVLPEVYGPGDLNKTHDRLRYIKTVIQGIIIGNKDSHTTINFGLDKNHVASYIYISDAVMGIYKAVQNIDHIGPFNICDDKPISIGELVSMVNSIGRFSNNIVWSNYDTSIVIDRSLDNRRFESVTSWSPKTNIYNGLKKTVPWFVDNLKKWY